jgi:hypothetical protein
MDTTTKADPAFALLTERIEALQAELAELRALAASRMPAGSALRRATAFHAERSLNETPMDVVQRDDTTALRVVSAEGRGAVLAGGAAPLRLLPAHEDDHPDTGRAGDLFVDAERRLWFCHGGDDWTQLA